jgi:hypothetical protein
MAKFTVVWSDDALDELAELWLKARDRQSISKSVAFIDAQLAGNPELKGKHILHGIRDLPVYPLRVLFTVSEADRLARVVHVSLILK